MAKAAEPVEQDQEAARAAALAQKWIAAVEADEKVGTPWLERSRRIARKYRQQRDETSTGQAIGERQYAMLWANTETILPSVYARPPEPVVTRRFKDADPVGRAASEVLERSLSYSVDAQDMDGMLRTAALDYVLIARGQAWVRYVPTFGPETSDKVKVLQLTTDAGVCYEDEDGNPVEPSQVEGDEETGYTADGPTYRPVVYEQAVADYVNFADFGHGPGRTWPEVPHVWRRVFMSRAQLVERFGEDLGNRIPLDYPAAKRGGAKTSDPTKAAIYEIWDKASRKAIWISKGWATAPLDVRDDPLRLENFFPCPRPMLGTLSNEDLLPTADYVLYQDQAEEIDELTAKIGQLQQALKVVGFYAGEAKLDIQLATAAPNTLLIPVKEWAGLKDDGGMNGRIEWFPIDKVVQALKACVELRAQIIEDVRQITGIADIMRGASDPRETLGAVAMKAQFGSVRVRDKQKELARFARDVVRLLAEIMAEHFAPETLASMSGVQLPTQADKMQLQAQIAQAQRAGQQVPPQVLEVMQSPTWEDVMALMRDDAKRGFRIDIETDSTIEPNEAAEKAQTVEFMQAVGGMIQTWGPAIQAAPVLAPMAAAFIKFGARRFRAGRELETIIDQTMDQIAAGGAGAPGGQQGAAPAPAPEPPDTTPVEVANLNLQREQIKQQGETQRAMIDAGIQGGDQRLRAGDQQLKIVSLQRDPNPQVNA